MATGSCMFAAVLASAELAPEVERRARRLRDFYSLDPLALTRPEPGVVVGALGAAAGLQPETGTLVWGEPLRGGFDLVDASDDQLRSICGVTAAIGWDHARVRIVNNSAGPATLYVAEGDGVIAYATHAVAAATLAGLPLRVDEAVVPEFIALDFVGGDRTLLERVRAVPPASDIGVDGGRSYWTAGERWQQTGEPYRHTEQALLATLSERTAGAQVGLALTAGLDSSVGAAALQAVGLKPLAFTWGEAEWPDAQGAAETAAMLGFEHEVLGIRALGDDESLRALDRDARWTDGVTALSAAERQWPPSCDTLAVGMGGETGRAFYYDAWSALLIPRPSSRELVVRLGAHARLRGAHADAIRALDRTIGGWLDEAHAAGARGWDALDVLYSEQRVRRWGRSQIPPLDQELVLLFTPTEVARGLASLPLRGRVASSFHRWFLAEHGLPREPDAVPNPGRIDLAARRLRHRLRRNRRTAATTDADAVDLLVHQAWAERPAAREWVREEALTDPLIAGTLGNAWAQATATRFVDGRARATERALRAAGVVAFARALADLK